MVQWNMFYRRMCGLPVCAWRNALRAHCPRTVRYCQGRTAGSPETLLWARLSVRYCQGRTVGSPETLLWAPLSAGLQLAPMNKSFLALKWNYLYNSFTVILLPYFSRCSVIAHTVAKPMNSTDSACIRRFPSYCVMYKWPADRRICRRMILVFYTTYLSIF
jgi:hypothetical protein